jgi:hypothetical protein
MKTYRMNEIQNKHGQRIYYFAKQPGNTELEKCINFINGMKTKYKRFDAQTTNGINITCIVVKGGFEVFNQFEEKVGECEINYNPLSIDYMWEDLQDLGFSI